MDLTALDWSSPSVTVLTLLLLGHVLADFLFQTNSLLAKKKDSIRALAKHAFLVALIQGACVLWFSWSLLGLGIVTWIALAHFIIESVSVRLDKRLTTHALAVFLLDQAAHVGVLLLAWKLWPVSEQAEPNGTVSQLALLITVIVFNANGGAAIVGKTLEALQQPDADSKRPKGAGKRIGVLERWIILALVWAGQWSAVGLVLTAKSIARFKKMDEQEFAEIYLVGTMTSVLIAMLSGGFLQLLIPLPIP